MIEAIIGIAIALALGVLIWFLRARAPKSIYVKRKDEADFYRGKRKPDDGFTQAQKSRIYFRDGGKCQMTGRKVWLGEPDKDEETTDAALKLASKLTGIDSIKREEGEIDHIIPREFGGPSTLWNGHLVARSYNRGKSSKWSMQAERLCRKNKWTVYLEPSELKEFQQRRNKQ